MAITNTRTETDVLNILNQLKSNITGAKVLDLYHEQFEKLKIPAERLQRLTTVAPEIATTLLSGEIVYDVGGRAHLFDIIDLQFSVGMNTELTRDDTSPLFRLTLYINNTGIKQGLEKKFLTYLLGMCTIEQLANEVAKSLKRKISNLSRSLTLNKLNFSDVLEGRISAYLFTNAQLAEEIRNEPSYAKALKYRTKEQILEFLPNAEDIFQLALKQPLTVGLYNSAESNLWILLDLFNEDKAEELFKVRMGNVRYMSPDDVLYHLILLNKLLKNKRPPFNIDANFVKSVILDALPIFNSSKWALNVHFYKNQCSNTNEIRGYINLYELQSNIKECMEKLEIDEPLFNKTINYPYESLASITPGARLVNVLESIDYSNLTFGDVYLPRIKNKYSLSSVEKLKADMTWFENFKKADVSTQYALSSILWFELITSTKYDLHHYLVILRPYKNAECKKFIERQLNLMYDDLRLYLIENWETYSKTIKNPIPLNVEKLTNLIEQLKSEISVYMGEEGESMSIELCPFVTY